MNFHVAQPGGLPNAQSPFRLFTETDQEIGWVNRFLDQQRVRGVADATRRSYSHALLHFLRWLFTTHHSCDVTADTDGIHAARLHSLRGQCDSGTCCRYYQSPGWDCRARLAV